MCLLAQEEGKYFLKPYDFCAGCKIHFLSFLFLFSSDAAQKKPIEIATQRLWGGFGPRPSTFLLLLNPLIVGGIGKGRSKTGQILQFLHYLGFLLRNYFDRLPFTRFS